jgi:uroporphyrinogen-III decarboxylase
MRCGRTSARPWWIRYPLQSRRDWTDYRERLMSNTPEHYRQRLAEYAAGERDRDYPLGIWLGGTYGFLRNWWGVEGISALFYDDPALVEEMVECLTALSLQTLDTVLAAGIKLDWVMFWEDMAYKTGPLVSPEMYRRFCMPFYRRVMDAVHAAGVPVVMLDSDGNVSELIPLWLDAGVSVMHPMEVAAGMDVVAVRRRYGRRVGFFGGIDKRVLATTPEQIRATVEPILRECFADGGFIPACDHAIPPDVPLSNYNYYRELVRKVSAEMFG